VYGKQSHVRKEILQMDQMPVHSRVSTYSLPLSDFTILICFSHCFSISALKTLKMVEASPLEPSK